jgi:hypothetical protein
MFNEKAALLSITDRMQAVGALLPVPLVAQIDAMAGQLLRSRSATIRDVLAAYFADRGMIKVSGRDAIDETLRLAGLDNIREQSR